MGATEVLGATLDLPAGPSDPSSWLLLSGGDALPADRRSELTLAAALVEGGSPVDMVNRFLLLGDGSLEKRLVECGDLDAEIVGLARRAATADRRDPVLALAEMGCDVLASRSRLALRTDDVPGSIGPFEIVCRIGHGGMGEVLLGVRPGLEKDFAIKRIRVLEGAEAQLLARFRREVQALSRLRHPNIVPLGDASLDGPEPWFAMEFVPGIDLGRRIRGGLTMAQAVRILEQIARALEHAHRHGILHRDLKPGNVAVDIEGEAYLMDFGLARVADGARGLTVDLIGTPHYIPPETFGRPQAYSARSDLYSLGVVLFESLTGRRPFEGRTLAEWMAQVQRRNAPRPSEFEPRVTPELDSLCERLLATDPRGRPESARAVAEELDAIASRWKTRQAVRRAGRPRFARGAIAGGAGVALLGTAAILAVVLASRPDPPPVEEPASPAPEPAGPPLPVEFRWIEPRIEGPVLPGTWGSARETTGRSVAYAGGVTTVPGASESTDVAFFWSLEPIDAAGTAYRWRVEPIPARPRRRAGLVRWGDEFVFFGGFPGPGWTADAFDDSWRRSPRGDWTPGPAFPLRDYEYLDAFALPEAGRMVVLMKRGKPGAGVVYEVERTEDAWRCVEREDLGNPRIVGSFEMAYDRARGRAIVVHPEVRGDASPFAIEELDLAGTWTPLSVEPPLGRMHRMTVVARDGCVVLSYSRAPGDKSNLLAGRIDEGRLLLQPLPKIGGIYDTLRVWIDDSTGHLLCLCHRQDWKDLPEVRAVPFEAGRGLLDR